MNAWTHGSVCKLGTGVFETLSELVLCLNALSSITRRNPPNTLMAIHSSQYLYVETHKVTEHMNVQIVSF